MDYAAVRDWPGYFQVMLGKPARETLARALELFDKEKPPESGRTAIDLGCGEGRDALELLRRGWTVTAIDSHPMAIDLLRGQAIACGAGSEGGVMDRLTTRIAPFDDPGWGRTPAMLLNASYCLPFCEPGRFEAVWARVVGAIQPGGRFAGQLFGDRDGWAALPDRTHHTRGRLDGLFERFVLEDLREEERDDKDALGNPKHWHVYHLVARKR
jgi:SAM-dependent methyltransferase